MQLSFLVSEETTASQQRAFELATDPARFPDFFTGNLVIAAVLSLELQGESPPKPGMLRLVHSADKTCITERVEVFDAPREHTYSLIDGFVPPTSWLIRGASGRWIVEPSGSGSRIDWHYSFELTNPLAVILAGPLLGIFFRLAMRNCLRAMCTELNQGGAG